MLQNLLSVIIASDEDGDFTIDPDEVDAMIRNIKAAGDFGVNAKLFRETVEKTGGKIQSVMDMCKSVLRDDGDKSDKEQIFYLLEDKS